MSNWVRCPSVLSLAFNQYHLGRSGARRDHIWKGEWKWKVILQNRLSKIHISEI